MGPWMGPWRALASFSCPQGAAEGLWLTQPFLVPYAAWGEGGVERDGEGRREKLEVPSF